MDAVFPDGRQREAEDMGARTVSEHGPGEQFVIQRWQVPHPAAPDAQRWEAELSGDGDTIQGRWLDRTAEGGWSHDFGLIYTRLG